MKYFFVLTLVFLTGCETQSSEEKDTSTDFQKTSDLTVNDTKESKDVITSKDANKDVLVPDTGGEDCGEEEIVRFNTSDGVELVADYLPPKSAGKGAVLLFHMIPPSNNRTSYPSRVRDAFSKEGYAVINVDRRGAGDSGGIAKDAYTGPKGRLDVEAAVEYILSEDRKCAVDSSKLLIIGASNGTTSVMDYTTGRSNTALPDPKAIAWLSPGAYTESQNKIEENKTILEALSVLIIHPTNEPWSNTYKSFSENWKVITLENGKHGTNNFDDGTLEAQQLPALIDWANANIGD